MTLVDGRKVAGRHVLGVDDVLDGHAHTVQRTALFEGDCIELASGSEDKLGIEVCPALHNGVARSNVFDQGRSTVDEL